MKSIVPIIISFLFSFCGSAWAAPPTFAGQQPLVGDITWSPGVDVDGYLVIRLKEAWAAWGQLSNGAVNPIMISSGTPRVTFHCSDKFPIGQLDGTDITVGDDVAVMTRHVNLSMRMCRNPSRIIMLHTVGHALGWDNDLETDDGVMGSSISWLYGSDDDQSFSSSDIAQFSSWYSKFER